MPAKKYGKDAKQKPRSQTDDEDGKLIDKLHRKVDEIGDGPHADLPEHIRPVRCHIRFQLFQRDIHKGTRFPVRDGWQDERAARLVPPAEEGLPPGIGIDRRRLDRLQSGGGSIQDAHDLRGICAALIK